ncbi:MAG: uroporphyrinogen decarboxylase family protein [Firmicutes bacterium]|nr:uroporphyrinogen decarboxylase family protein [Bacillota bacterium]
MNMYNWVDNLISQKVKIPMPILSFPGVQMLGISVKEMLESDEKQAQCIKAIADEFNFAAALGHMDLSIEAEAFGSKIKFDDAEVPTVLGSIIDTEQDAQNLVVPEIGAGRTGVCVKAAENAKKLITDRPFFAGVIGPFSLSGRMMDMTEIMVKCLIEPEITHIVLKKATEFLKKYTLAMKNAGADGVIIAEPAAGLLSPAICEEFSSKYVKEIVDAVQDENFIVIYHNCGNTIPLIDSILSVGAKAYHFGDAVDIGLVLEKMPKDIPVMGNLSPAEHFKGGTPQSVYKATKEMLEKTRGYNNYIPSSGCDIPPLTPLENIHAFLNAILDFYS